MRPIRTLAALLGLVLAAAAGAAVPSSSSSSGPYTCDGTTTVAFPVTFGFLENAHLQVTKKQTSTGTVSGLAIGTDYTVSGAGGSSGTVTLVSAAKCASGYTLTIARVVPVTQPSSFSSVNPVSPRAVERALDRVVHMAQQLDRKDGAIDEALALKRNTSDQSARDAAQDDQIAASRGTNGYTSVADSSTVLAPGSNTARTLSAWFGDQVNVAAFGAIPDDGIDDAPAINAAIAYSKKSTTWGTMGKGVIFPAGVYDTFATISIPWDFYKWRLSGFGGYAVLNAHGDFDTIQIDAAGGIMENMQIGRAAPTATGVGLNVRAPENRFLRVRVSGGHAIGIESNGFCRSGTAGCIIDTVAYRGAHMNYYQAVQIDTANNGVGMNDRGRSIANDFVACNIINNTDGWIWRSGDFHWIGGQLEQNYQHDILCSTTADESGAFGCAGVFLGTHFEAHTPGGPTDAMAVLGPPDQTSDRVFVVFEGNPWAGNSITGAGVRIQGAGATFIGNRFRDFNLGGGHSVVELTQYARRVTFLTNQYATAQPHKSIDADAGYVLDFEEGSTGKHSASFTHTFGSGGALEGIGLISGAARPDVGLRLESRQSAPNAAAFAVATTLADNTTLIDRLDIGGGEAVPWVSFYNSKVRLSATYANPFGCGMDRYCWWDNGNNLRAKKASAPGADLPSSEIDGRIIGSTDHSVSWGSGPPDTSGWARGDVLWNTGAAAGGAPGWVCVNAGGCSAAAHWKAMANLAP